MLKDDLLPDHIIAKHEAAANGEADTGADDEFEDPNLAEDTDSPDDLDGEDLEGADTEEDDESGDDTASDKDEDGDLDEDDDLEEDSDEDDLEDDEDDLDEEDLDEETTKAVDLTKALPEFDRKKLNEQIRKNPELGKAYKHLQAQATRASQEAARQVKAAEQRIQQQDEFMERVSTREGAIDFLKNVVLQNAEVVGAAFEEMLGGDDAEALLIEIGLEKPELLAKVQARLDELEEDPREKKIHIRDRETARKAKKVEREEKKIEAERRAARAGEIRSSMERYTERAGLDEEAASEVTARVKAKINENGSRKGGKRDISDAEIKQIVLDVRKAERAREERIRTRLEREGRRTKGAKVKEKLRQKARPPVARTAGSQAVRRKAPAVPKGRDPLDFAIENAASRTRD